MGTASDRKNQLRKARAVKALKRVTSPKPKKRKLQRSMLSKQKFLRALQGTGGVVSEISRRLGVAQNVVRQRLSNSTGRWDDWDDVRQAYVDECERVHDLAEKTLIDALSSRDEDVRIRTAQWWLERRRPAIFAGRSKLTVEGGDKPIQIQVATVDVTQLSIATRRMMLAEMRQQGLLGGPAAALPEPVSEEGRGEEAGAIVGGGEAVVEEPAE